MNILVFHSATRATNYVVKNAITMYLTAVSNHSWHIKAWKDPAIEISLRKTLAIMLVYTALYYGPVCGNILVM